MGTVVSSPDKSKRPQKMSEHIFIHLFKDSDFDYESIGTIISTNIVYTLFPVDLVETFINSSEYQIEVKRYILTKSNSKYSTEDKLIIVTIVPDNFFEHI